MYAKEIVLAIIVIYCIISLTNYKFTFFTKLKHNASNFFRKTFEDPYLY